MRLALLVVDAVHDAADGEPQELVDLAHPLRVALSEVVVDGDDVHALAGERVQIDGQRGDERLALARLHLGDLALVQHHAADELHVEVALAQRALGGLAHGGEGRHQEIVERRPVLQLAAEILGARLELGVAQSGDLRLERVDGLDAGPIALDAALVRRAEDLCRVTADRGKHSKGSSNSQRAAGETAVSRAVESCPP